LRPRYPGFSLRWLASTADAINQRKRIRRHCIAAPGHLLIRSRQEHPATIVVVAVWPLPVENFQRHTLLPHQASVRPFPRRQISLPHHVIFFGSTNAFREPH
jgi:hypothetical protein